ncbi:MAG: cytochrome C oxidase subunit IV family protein [Gemmatimonadota bacterium]
METQIEHKTPNYYLIWVVLFVLTLAEVGVAFVSSIPRQVLILLLLAMAVWKALLVAMYYMHLKFEPRKLWVMAAAPLPLAVILVVIVLAEKW